MTKKHNLQLKERLAIGMLVNKSPQISLNKASDICGQPRSTVYNYANFYKNLRNGSKPDPNRDKATLILEELDLWSLEKLVAYIRQPQNKIG